MAENMIKLGIKIDSTGAEKDLQSVIKKLSDNNVKIKFDDKNINFANINKQLSEIQNRLQQAFSFNTINKSAQDSAKVFQGLADEIGKLHEKSNLKLTTKEGLQEAKEVNKALEEQYKLEQQMAEIRSKADSNKKQRSDDSELKQALAINKALEENYALEQKQIQNINKLKDSIQSKISTANKNEFVDSKVITELQNKLNSINTNTPEREIKELETAIKNLASSDSNIVRIQNAITKFASSYDNIKNKISEGSLIGNDKTEEKLKEYETELNKLKSLQNQLQNGKVFSGSKITSELNGINNASRELNYTLEKTMHTCESFGTRLKDALGNMGVYFTAYQGVMLGINTIKDAVETITSVDTKMRDLRRVTDDATSEQLNNFPQQANEMAIALGQTTENAIQATAVWKQLGYSWRDATEYLSKESMVLSNVGDMTAEDSTNALVSTLKAFKLEAKDTTMVVDSLNEAGNRFAIKTGELAEGLRVGGASLAIANNSLEQSEALIITGTEVLRDSNEVANGLKTISMRLNQVKTEGGDTFYKLQDDLKKLASTDLVDANGNLRSTYDIILDLSGAWGSLSDMNQAKLLDEVAGKNQAKVLSSIIQNAEQLPKAYEAMKNSAGSSTKEQERYMDSIEAKTNALKESVKKLWIQMISSDIIKQVVDSLTSVVTVLSQVDGGTVKIIATFTVLGMVLKSIGTFTNALKGVETVANLGKDAGVIGGLTKGFTSMGTSIKSVTTASLSFIATPLGASLTALALIIGSSIATYETYQKLISKPLDTPTEELSEFEQTVNSFTGGIYKSKKELQDAGLVYKDFGEDISDSFKDGVEKATDSYHEFEMALTKSNIDDKTSNENAKAIKGLVNDIVDEAKSTIMSRKSEVQNEMSKLFTAGDSKIDSREQNILDYLGQGYNEKFDTIQEINQKIYDTWNKAIQDHGKLSEEDIALIKKYVQQVQQIEMEAKANNESEQNFAKNQFIERLSGISAKDATEVYQKAKKGLDESNADARASYDTGLQDLKKYHNQLLQEKEQALKDGDTEKAKLKQSIADETQIQIDAKEDEYQKLIQKQRTLQKEYLEELYKKNPNLKGKINEIDGSEFTGEDINAQENIRKVTEQFDEIANATETGIKHVQDKAGNWHDVYVTIDKNTGKITSTYDSFTKETGGYTEEFEKQADEFANKYNDGLKRIQDALTGTHMGFGKIDGSNQLLDNAGNILTTLENVETQADGTKEAIVSLNGQEIVIKTNAEGTITNLDEIYTKLGLLPEGKTIRINAETGAVEIIDKVEGKVDEVDGKTGTVNVDANTSQADLNLDITSEKVNTLDGQSAEAKVSVNTGNTFSIIDSIKSFFNWFSGKNATATVNVVRTEQDTFDENRTQLNADGSVGHNAKGTDNWSGGLTWINEEGGELVNLPDGTQIIPHDLSKKIIEEESKNNNSDIIVNKIDIYQNKLNTSDILDVNKTNTLNSEYNSETTKENASDEEEKRLKDRVDKEKQYLKDIGTAWESNKDRVTNSIDELELKELEYGDNISFSQKIDILNQKYQRQVDLLPEAQKQLNTYLNTTLDTSEGQEELSKRIQDATSTLIEQKKAVIEAYKELQKLLNEQIKQSLEKEKSIAEMELESKQAYDTKALEEYTKQQEETHNARMDALDAELDVLEKQNEEEDKANELQEKKNALKQAEIDLERLKNQQTIQTFSKDKNGNWNFSYTYDKQAVLEKQKQVEEAKKSLEETRRKQEYEEAKQAIEDQKKAEEDLYKKKEEYLKKYSDNLKEQQGLEKQRLDEYYSDLEQLAKDRLHQLEQQYGDNWDAIATAIQTKLSETEEKFKQLNTIKLNFGLSGVQESLNTNDITGYLISKRDEIDKATKLDLEGINSYIQSIDLSAQELSKTYDDVLAVQDKNKITDDDLKSRKIQTGQIISVDANGLEQQLKNLEDIDLKLETEKDSHYRKELERQNKAQADELDSFKKFAEEYLLATNKFTELLQLVYDFRFSNVVTIVDNAGELISQALEAWSEAYVDFAKIWNSMNDEDHQIANKIEIKDSLSTIDKTHTSVIQWKIDKSKLYTPETFEEYASQIGSGIADSLLNKLNNYTSTTGVTTNTSNSSTVNNSNKSNTINTTNVNISQLDVNTKDAQNLLNQLLTIVNNKTKLS